MEWRKQIEKCDLKPTFKQQKENRKGVDHPTLSKEEERIFSKGNFCEVNENRKILFIMVDTGSIEVLCCYLIINPINIGANR